jgi:hypothetical protein
LFGRHYSLQQFSSVLRHTSCAVWPVLAKQKLLKTFDISNFDEQHCQHSTLAEFKQVVFYTNSPYWLVSRLPANTLDYQEAKFKTSIPLTSDFSLRTNVKLLIYILTADEKSPH